MIHPRGRLAPYPLTVCDTTRCMRSIVVLDARMPFPSTRLAILPPSRVALRLAARLVAIDARRSEVFERVFVAVNVVNLISVLTTYMHNCLSSTSWRCAFIVNACVLVARTSEHLWP